jgi:hypothetical protein
LIRDRFVQFGFDKKKELDWKYGVYLHSQQFLLYQQNGDIINEFEGDRNKSSDLIKFTEDSLSKI